MKGYSGIEILVLEGEVVMKKISFRVRNFDKEQFLTFNIDNEAELDEEMLDFIEDEEPAGIVPVIFEEGEEFDTFSYNVTDKIRLSELSNQEINAEMVLMVLRGLVLTLIDMAEYRIPISYLVLNRNYIYVDSEYKIEFVCIPLEDMQEEVDLSSFLRNFLASLRYEPSENGDYVARLFTYINNHAIFNLRNLITLVEELMENMGIEIPQDDSAEIYVEYHEVDEEDADGEGAQFDSFAGDTTVLTEEADSEEEEIEPDAEEEIEEADIAEADMEKEKEAFEEEVIEDPAVQETTGELAEDEQEDDDIISEDPEEVPGEEDVEKPDRRAEEETQEPEEVAVTDEKPDESQEIVNKIKEKLSRNNNAKNTEEEDLEDINNDSKNKESKKSIFKTKEVTGVVIQDELDEFLAEKELEEKMTPHEESGLKIKKNIKINRASIVKNTQEELKAAEESAETEVTETEDEEDIVSNSILSQTIGASGILKGAAVPKANPYLIRVNTDERVMITKQNFKIGKASMGVDYTVKGNGAVSRVHAIITNKDGIYYIKDNKSTNHTFVNGKTIEEGESELLTHDCKIVLGDEEFIFKLR